MIIIDSAHKASLPATVIGAREVNPFRIDPARELALPDRYVGDRIRATLLAKVVSLCERRGRTIASLSARPSEGETRHFDHKVQRIDEQLVALTHRHHELFVSDPTFHSVYVSHAHKAENYARFISIAHDFYEQGVNLGEAHGRTIHRERLRNAEDQVVQLHVLLNRFHSGAPIREALRREAVNSNVPNPGRASFRGELRDALDAAAELGKRNGVMNHIQADVTAAKVYRAIGGWRTFIPLTIVKDAHAVEQALHGLSKADAGLVQQAYQELTGEELKPVLLKAFGPKRAAAFFLALDAEDTTAAVVALKKEFEGIQLPIFRQEPIRTIYSNLSRGQIAEVETELRGGTYLRGRTVAECVSSLVSESVDREIRAYRDGDPLSAQVIRIDRALRSWFGKGGVRSVLRDCESERLDELVAKYQAVSGLDLRAQIKLRMPRSPDRDLCLALLDRDELRIRAANVACALAYRRDFIAGPFLALDEAGRQQLIRDYESVYQKSGMSLGAHKVTGHFWEDLKKCVWRDDYSFLSSLPSLCTMLDRVWWPTTGSYPFIESVIKNGRLSSAELTRYFMIGIGTDIEGIYAVLGNRSQSAIRAIEEDYAKRYRSGMLSRLLGRVPIVGNFVLIGDLRHDLKVELSGDNEFDIEQMLHGFRDNSSTKQLCSHVFATLVLRKRHETSGILTKWSRLAALRGDSVVRKRYEEDHAIAVVYFKKHIASERNPGMDKVVRFLTLARLAEIQANSFRETKSLLGNVFLNSGAFVGVILGTAGVLTLTTFSYPMVATASFVGSLTWRLAIGRCVLGRGFGRGEIVFQSVRAFIDGISIFTVQVGVATLGQFLGGQISSSAAKGGFKTSFNKMIKSMENRIRRQDKARHVLERGSVIQSNEDLRSVIQGYVAALGDGPWQVGEGGNDVVPPLGRMLTV